MQLRVEQQVNPVGDEVSAITAVVRPILIGVLFALKGQVADESGGYENVKLFMLPRLYRPGDGDCGICFEYAVHDAVLRRRADVVDRLTDSMTGLCNVPGSAAASILFGAEKTGSQQLIDTSSNLLTTDSLLMYGTRGRPAKLKHHLTGIASAFRKPPARLALPLSIQGLWKADLFLGYSDTDKWLGTSVKINRSDLEPARGLRLGIVPAREGESDLPSKDEGKNLVVIPLPYDGSFMEVFYQAWGVVQQFISADAHVPREVALPRPAERQVARYLEDRRDFPVVDVVEALKPISQPQLLDTSTRQAELVNTGHTSAELEATALLAPLARRI